MTKLISIGVDVDGVLADFTESYNKILSRLHGEDLLKGEDPPCWYWPTAIGYTAEHDAQAWKEIKESPDFWARLRPTLEAAPTLIGLSHSYANGHNVYFLTDRMGIAPHMQTAAWLMAHGYAGPPQVLLTCAVKDKEGKSVGVKGHAAKALALTHFIDDKPENCIDVKLMNPLCRVAMLSKRYNRLQHELVQAAGVEVTTTINEFFRSIGRELELLNAIA